jgi:hypothetical protein
MAAAWQELAGQFTPPAVNQPCYPFKESEEQEI